MTTKRPEFWQGVPISSAKTIGTTSAQSTYAELVLVSPLSAAAFEGELAALEGHSAMSENGDREDVRRYGREGRALLAPLREALDRGDADAAAEAAYHLGRHVEEWRAKDHTETYFLRGLKALRVLLAAGLKAKKAKAVKARRRRKPRAWLAAVTSRRYGTESAVINRIAEREGKKSGTIRKALYRLRARLK